MIVGGGFGGLSAAERLNSNLVDVTFIDRRNYYLFQPLLYHGATGTPSVGEITSRFGIPTGTKYSEGVNHEFESSFRSSRRSLPGKRADGQDRIRFERAPAA